MPKGLHKNSLRNGDNPHQWMIDDARMELIQQIKAEIERRIRSIENCPFIEAEFGAQEKRDGKLIAYKNLLSFFDTLQEKSEKPINPKPMMIEWTGNNLKEVIEFTGKSPRFDEWFKTWDEYESYVHSHGNILKLFNKDGTHLEVPVGAWIFKTPDGWNVPSTFLLPRATVKKDNPLFDSCLAKVNPETREEVRKNIDKMIEQPVCEELEDEIYKEKAKVALSFGGVTGEQDRILIGFARHFYELGKQSKCVKVKAESSIDRFILENCTHCRIEHCPGVKACYTSSNKQLQ